VVNAVVAWLDPAFWRGRRVLITGHTGFKGSWLALWLLELGAEVVGVALDPPTTPSLFAQLQLAELGLVDHRCDLRDGERLAALVARHRPQVVMHLAAQSLVREGYRAPIDTWSTNVLGTLQLLEALRQVDDTCAVVAVTTDKVYANAEHGEPFREDAPLGGHDPYSASKAGMELAVASWRKSYCGDAPHQTPHLRLATARAGNVIGGGDWGLDRIVPDAIRALQRGEPIEVRNPNSVRPWQHVLDPLMGYLLLAERLSRTSANQDTCFNYGPTADDQRSVQNLVETLLQHWPGQWRHCSEHAAPHESTRLLLDAERARKVLGWQPRWGFREAVARTADWYWLLHTGGSARQICQEQLIAFTRCQ
jgi:CDP-glucose 4,6-dehydratase